MQQQQTHTSDELIGKYVELREKLAVVNKEAEAIAAPIKEAMSVIASYMLNLFNESGETSKKTDRGTAFIKESTFIGVNDWPEVLKFIQDGEAWEFLNRAVNKTAVTTYMKEHEDATPPGVNISKKREVQFRKPTK